MEGTVLFQISRTGRPWSHVKALEDKSIRSLGRKLYYQLFILRIIYKASSVPSSGGMHWNLIATCPSSDLPGQSKGSVLHLPTSASLEIIFISPPRMHHHWIQSVFLATHSSTNLRSFWPLFNRISNMSFPRHARTRLFMGSVRSVSSTVRKCIQFSLKSFVLLFKLRIDPG
jgi:hypothetical protein